MGTRKYRILFHAIPDDSWPLKEGYFGEVPGVYINEPIYCRVSKSKAYLFTREGAIDRISRFRELGYPCHAEPPIQVTY